MGGLRFFPCLSSVALRHASCTCVGWKRALDVAPADIQQRSRWLWRWQHTGGGAKLQLAEPEVVSGGGGWHPGGVALANQELTSESRSAWRVELESPAYFGDLIVGITRGLAGEVLLPMLAADDELLPIGYEYIMGRPGAPASIFYGGRSLRCCFSDGDGRGPRIDYAQLPSGTLSDVRLSKLRSAGDWVEFQLKDGSLRARDHAGKEFEWGVKVQPGEIWLATVAWTGSTAEVRLSPPLCFDIG